MFSGRLPALAPNRLRFALDARRRAGRPYIDLTDTNPTRVGLEYPKTLLAPLGDEGALVYEPDPHGLRRAREAIAIDLLRLGVEADPARLVLTASTSEAYGFLFKLLCDPGDHVLVPAPSYPLFEHLTRLEAAEAVPYPLDPHGDWSLDVASIARRVTSRTRAVLVVNPNNPTGTRLRPADLGPLASLCREAGLVLVGDEVFADYCFPVAQSRDATATEASGSARFVSVLHQRECLTCSLGGLSKSIGAPQLKLAWMALNGPEPSVGEALERLALIADTYLSVSTPVQRALPALLEDGKLVRGLIYDRVLSNLQALRRALARAPACSLVEPGGGWSAVVRVPGSEPEETRVLGLLERHGVLVTPGYFYDFPFEAFVVVSLLLQPDLFRAGIDRLVDAVSASPLPVEGTSANLR